MLRKALLLCGLAATLVLALASTGWCVPEISAGPVQSGLNIQSVEFEPIGTGKNVVQVSVANPTAVQKGLLIDVLTNGRSDLGRQCFTMVKAGETRNIRCVFPLIGPVANDASVRLRFYESVSAKGYDESQYFQQQRFNLTEMPLKTPAERKALPPSDRRAVQAKRTFKSFQQLLRQGKYHTIWDTVFSKDYQDAGFQSPDIFAKAMTDRDDWACLYFWDRETLLGMRPVAAGSSGDLIVLSVTNGKETWEITFIPSERGWQIDWMDGFEPAILHTPDIEKLFATTQTFNYQHIVVRYFKNSTAERDLSTIAMSRERAYAKIIECLGLPELPGDQKIILYLFEDMKTMSLYTGVVGMGQAGNDGDGNYVLLEVYNKKNRLDPHHETTHVLLLPYGEPPAILNEGLAVYMSERLGGMRALRYLGGKDQALYARVCEFKQKGEWISLQELLTHTNIGTQGDRTVLAYVQAGAFAKYLMETYGKDKFLEAFKTLTNSEDPEIRRRNQQEFERIYGSPVQKLEGDWERSFLSNSR